MTVIDERDDARASRDAAIRREQILGAAIDDALNYLDDDDPGLARAALQQARAEVGP